MALRRGRAPDGVLSWNDLQATVNQVNAQVQEETDREWSPGRAEAAHPLPGPSAHRRLSCPEVLAVSLINEALDQGSPEKTLSALLLPSAGLDDVHLPVARRYHFLLVAAKRRKAQVRSASVAGAERASAVGRAVPGCTWGQPSLMRVRSGGGGQEGPWGEVAPGQGAGPSSGCQHAEGGGGLCVGRAQAWGPENGAALPALTLGDVVTSSKSRVSELCQRVRNVLHALVLRAFWNGGNHTIGERGGVLSL